MAGLLGHFRVGGDEQELAAEDVMKQADGSVEHGGLDDFRARDGEDIADEHVLEVLGFAGGLAHGEDGGGGGDGVGDADEGFQRDASAMGSYQGEDAQDSARDSVCRCYRADGSRHNRWNRCDKPNHPGP